MGPELLDELDTYGHIYGYRFRPDYEIRPYPLAAYPAVCRQAAVVQHMIMNNLSRAVAQVTAKPFSPSLESFSFMFTIVYHITNYIHRQTTK